MKSILFSFLLLVAIGGSSQEINRKAIPGTKISLIPPAGFIAATVFSGFQQEQTGSSIMVNEIGTAVATLTAGFTADAMKAKGMTLIEKKPVNWNDGKATLVKLSQEANGMKYLKQILIFGDDKRTFLINAIYPESAKALENVLYTSILSSRYNENQDSNPLAAAPFEISTTGTGFLFTRYLSGSLLYTTDGKIPTQSADKGMLMVSGSLGQHTSGDKKEYAIERLKKLPRGEASVISSTTPVTINNMEGYEIVADGKDDAGNKQLVYQVMLFAGSGEYYIIVGYSSGKFDTYLASFKKIANTFRKK